MSDKIKIRLYSAEKAKEKTEHINEILSKEEVEVRIETEKQGETYLIFKGRPKGNERNAGRKKKNLPEAYSDKEILELASQSKKSELAERLGMSRKTLYRRLNEIKEKEGKKNE